MSTYPRSIRAYHISILFYNFHSLVSTNIERKYIEYQEEGTDFPSHIFIFLCIFGNALAALTCGCSLH
jgi:hypothetical protein